MGKFISLPNYPTSAWGATRVAKGDWFGSNNYQQPGETLVPQTFGFTGLESAGFSGGGFSNSNNYYARVTYPANTSSNTEAQAPTFGQTPSAANNTNAPVVTIYIASNNAQVANNTNLSAECFKLEAFGV